MDAAAVSKPLAGLRIVEMGGIGPVPFAAMMLSDHGASTVCIQRPGGSIAPFDPRDALSRGRSEVVTLDLASDAGRGRALDLCRGADAILEGFRPGVMERLGLGPDVLRRDNDKLVYGRMTGWGQDGPLSGDVGHDINYLALSGVLSTIVDGDGRPVPPQNMLADYAGGGMMLAFGVLAALLAVRNGASGQVVDAAMVEGAATIGAFARSMTVLGLHPGPPGKNLLDGGAPFYRCYRCADGNYVAVGAIEPQFHAALLGGLGLAGDPGFAHQMDSAQWPARIARLDAVFAGRTRDEWAGHFAGTDACVSPVLSLDEAAHHPHAIARGSFVEQDGTIQSAPAPRFSS
jgi:alpha-methylacyl-CoA racemase